MLHLFPLDAFAVQLGKGKYYHLNEHAGQNTTWYLSSSAVKLQCYCQNKSNTYRPRNRKTRVSITHNRSHTGSNKGHNQMGKNGYLATVDVNHHMKKEITLEKALSNTFQTWLLLLTWTCLIKNKNNIVWRWTGKQASYTTP